MNKAIQFDKSMILQRLVIVTALLLLIIGPNFGPIPLTLRQSLSMEGSILGMLIWFLIGFSVIIAVILRISGMSLQELLRYVGVGSPSRLGPNIVGVIVGLLLAASFFGNILQFAPETNIAQINGFRILAALIATLGVALEDIITRGWLMNQLRDIQVPNWIQVFASALLFALYHTVWAGFNIFSFIASMVLGLIMAGLFLWGNRSLTPVLISHMLPVLLAEPFASMLIFLVPNL
ncbi:MAG: CPBP family intramembrane glutamic endopeptidase [Chloroflexota bacterium]